MGLTTLILILIHIGRREPEVTTHERPRIALDQLRPLVGSKMVKEYGGGRRTQYAGNSRKIS